MSSQLEKYCEEHGHRLTRPRKAVYEIISKNKAAVGAYEIIEKLSSSESSTKPPTVYRALEFLLKHQFIHRIESLNSYIACHEDHAHGGSQFIICDSCESIEEIHLCHLPKDISNKIKANSFEMTFWNTEIHGTCHACSS